MQGFYVIHPHLIIQHKVSFSSHLVSFHFSFLKNEILYNFTCDFLLSLRISELKCGQACGKNMTKNSQVNGSLRENVSIF